MNHLLSELESLEYQVRKVKYKLDRVDTFQKIEQYFSDERNVIKFHPNFRGVRRINKEDPMIRFIFTKANVLVYDNENNTFNLFIIIDGNPHRRLVERENLLPGIIDFYEGAVIK